MFRSRCLGLVGYSALLVTLASGCHLLCRDRPVSVLAKDAETGQSLPDADVKSLVFRFEGEWNMFFR
jgi:hypothetical protein